MANYDETIRAKIVVEKDTRQAKEAAKDVDAVAESTEKLGEEFKETAKQAKSFDEQLKELTRQRAEYAEKIRTADGDERKAHLKRFSSISREMGLLTKLKAAAETVKLPDLQFGDFAGWKGPAIGAAAPIGFALASAIGGALSGAVAGGAVAAGVAGAMFAASKSAEVKAAAKDLGATVSSEFFGAGAGLSKPTAEALNILAGDFKSLDLAGLFAKAEPAITNLAHGIGDLVTGIMPGFNKIMDRSGVISAVFADGLANVGDAIGDLLGDVAESRGTLTGLRTLMDAISGTIRGTGNTVTWLGDRWHDLTVAGGELTGNLEDIIGWMPILGDYVEWNNDNFERWSNTGEGLVTTMHAANTEAGRLAEQTRLTGIATDTAAQRTQNYLDWMTKLNDEMNEQIDLQSDLYKAQLAANDGLRVFKEQLAENYGQWNSNTEAGNQNLSMLVQQIEKARQVRDAQIELGEGSVEAQRKAQKEYNKTVDDLLAIAKQAGLTESQLRKLAGIYKISVTAEFPGQQAADWSMLRIKERQAEGRASGGPVLAGVPYMINEAGRETVTFPANGMVHSANLSPVAQSQATAIRISFDVTGMDEDLKRWIRNSVRIEGGGNVQLAFGRN